MLKQGGSLIQHEWCSYKKRRETQREEQREDPYVKTEAEVGVIPPQAMGGPGLPEPRRGEEASSPRTFEGVWHCPQPDFGSLAFRTARECISVVLAARFVVLLRQSLEMNTLDIQGGLG